MNIGIYVAVGMMLFLFGFSIQNSNTKNSPQAVNIKKTIPHPDHTQARPPLAVNNEAKIDMAWEATAFETTAIELKRYEVHAQSSIKGIDAEYMRQ